MVKCVITTNDNGEPVAISKVKDFTEQELKEVQEFCRANAEKETAKLKREKKAEESFKEQTTSRIVELEKTIRKLELEIQYDRGYITAEELEQAKGEIENE